MRSEEDGLSQDTVNHGSQISCDDRPDLLRARFMPNLPSALPLDEGKRLPALDGLRGLAVLLVLLDHASDARIRLFEAANMNRAGKYGVYLFFVLSAFLLTHLLLLRPAAELARARTWLNYALRRFLRIFPLYALVLVVMVRLHKFQWHHVWTHLAL